MPKKCLTCGWTKAPDQARFCAMCGEDALECIDLSSEGAPANQEATKPPENRNDPTEVISSEEVRGRLDRMKESMEASPEQASGAERDPRSSRSFSETMWFIRGLDFDQLVDDSEEVRQNDLQDRYEGQEEVRDGIRKQFSLSSDFDDEDEIDE